MLDTKNPLFHKIAAAEKALFTHQALKAETLFTEVLQSAELNILNDKLKAGCFVNRGSARRMLGRPYEALEDYKSAAALNPDSFKPHFNAGLIYAQDLGDYVRALENFDRACLLNPTDPEILSSRGLTKVLNGDSQGGEQDLSGALQIDPRHVNSLCNLGNLRVKQRRVAEAAEYYRQALDIEPSDDEIRHNLVMALEIIGSPDADRAAAAERGKVKKAQPGAKAQVPGPWKVNAGITVIIIVLVVAFAVLNTNPQFSSAAKQFATDHPLVVGLSLAALAFILNSARRWSKTIAQIPPEEHLRLIMQRASRGVRRLHRSRRRLMRYAAHVEVRRGSPDLGMMQRLNKARSDASYAEYHLSAVLKQAPRYGASIEILQKLEQLAHKAKIAEQTCRQAVYAPPAAPVSPMPISPDDVERAFRDTDKLLSEAKCVQENWARTIQEAQGKIAQSVDPMIVRSGGVLRNPFKAESQIEDAQSTSVLELRYAREDLSRVERGLVLVNNSLRAAQRSYEQNPHEAAQQIGMALDSIDEILGDAEHPLPTELVSGETIFDCDSEGVKLGILQTMYETLLPIEVELESG